MLGDAETNHEVRCGACWSLLDWTARDGAYVRVPYGTLVDEPGVTARFRRPTCSPIRAAPRPTSSAAPIGVVSPRSKESASPAMFRG